MIDAWHRARDRGGDAELEYGDRHPECVIEFPQSGEPTLRAPETRERRGLGDPP